MWGTSRDVVAASMANFRTLGMDGVSLLTLNTLDVDDIRAILRRIAPCEIYNLSGQSSVARSFLDPAGTHASIAIATINILEAARAECPQARMYFACSSECFGDIQGAADETTPFAPRSPYAVAKVAAHWTVSNYRTAYGLFACSGILFNHESPLRQPHYVTRKIVQGAARIAGGSGERLSLGNLQIRRDWGWAGDYVAAMWLMLQQDAPEDFVIATGVSTTLEEFVQAVFAGYDLDWRAHVDIDRTLFRPNDIAQSCGNARRARERLGWEAQIVMPDLGARLVACEKGLRSP